MANNYFYLLVVTSALRLVSLFDLYYAHFFYSNIVGPRTNGACSFTDWSRFGPCSATCGEGRRARVRRLIDVEDRVDFVNCSGNLTDLQPCNLGPCISKFSFIRISGT